MTARASAARPTNRVTFTLCPSDSCVELDGSPTEGYMMSSLGDLLKSPGAAIEAEDDFDAINALYMERGWGDGLPIVPPTAERLERMLAYCDRPWDQPVAKIAPRYGE